MSTRLSGGLLAAVLAGAATFGGAAAGEVPREVPYVPGQPMPDGAGPGEAWCLFHYPAVFETVVVEGEEAAKPPERVETRPAMTIMRPVPAEFGKETAEYVSEPAYSTFEVTPPVWKEVAEVVEIAPAHRAGATLEDEDRVYEYRPAWTSIQVAPAEFAVEQVTFQICPERVEMQQVACVDGTRIDCFAVVKIPAQAVTAQVKKLVKPARTIPLQAPAEMKTYKAQRVVKDGPEDAATVPARTAEITRQVLDRPAQAKEKKVAEKRFTVTSVKVLRDATVRQEVLPAEFTELAVEDGKRQVLKQPARAVWRLQRVKPVAGAAPGLAAPAPAPEEKPTDGGE